MSLTCFPPRSVERGPTSAQVSPTLQRSKSFYLDWPVAEAPLNQANLDKLAKTLQEEPSSPLSTPSGSQAQGTNKYKNALKSVMLHLFPRPLLSYLERQLLFPGASRAIRQKAPELETFKTSIHQMKDPYLTRLAHQIQEVFFPSQHQNKRIVHRAWFVPPIGKMPTILLSGPNCGDLGQIEDLFPFCFVGMGALVYEYPGYGKTKGKPSEGSLYRSVEAASDYLAQQGIHPHQQIAYGISLGGGVSTHIAAQRPLKGLILKATFTNIEQTAQHMIQKYLHPALSPLSQKIQNRFDSLSTIQAVQCPVLILHAEEDPLLPVEFAHTLYNAAPTTHKTLEIIPAKSHLLASNTVNPHLWDFLDRFDLD